MKSKKPEAPISAESEGLVPLGPNKFKIESDSLEAEPLKENF